MNTVIYNIIKGLEKVGDIYIFLWKPISKLQNITWHMRSDSVTCHPIQVNAPHL